MPSSIVPSNFKDLSKEFKTDEEGKVFVSRRGLARMCGKQAPTITRLLENIKNCSGTCTSSESLESLLGQSFEGVASISDLVVPLIIEHYAFSGSIEARKHLRIVTTGHVGSSGLDPVNAWGDLSSTGNDVNQSQQDGSLNQESPDFQVR